MNVDYTTIIFIVLIISIVIGYLLIVGINNRRAMINNLYRGDNMINSFEIHPNAVTEKIKNNKDIILLDVRTPEEYKEKRLMGSILLPIQELSQRTLANIGLGIGSKNKEIIIYCRSGVRSKTAYDIMNTLGYTNIKSVAGGIEHLDKVNKINYE